MIGKKLSREKTPQPVNAVVLVIDLPVPLLRLFHPFWEDEVAVLGHQQKQEPVYQPQQLPVVVAGFEGAV